MTVNPRHLVQKYEDVANKILGSDPKRKHGPAFTLMTDRELSRQATGRQKTLAHNPEMLSRSGSRLSEPSSEELLLDQERAEIAQRIAAKVVELLCTDRMALAVLKASRKEGIPFAKTQALAQETKLTTDHVESAKARIRSSRDKVARQYQAELKILFKGGAK